MIRKPNFKLNWKYALGELLLIFLGISLAIAFQNWNEDRKNNIERNKILKNLQAELKEDSTAYADILWLLEDRQKRIQEVMDLLDKPPTSLDSGQFIISSMRAGFITSYIPNFSVYKELVGSGKLTLIKSNELKRSLALYMTSVERIIQLGTNYYPFSKQLEKITLKHFSEVPDVIGYNNNPPESYKKIRFNLLEMKKDKELRNSLLMAMYSTKVERTYQQGEVVGKLQSLLVLLDDLIKK